MGSIQLDKNTTIIFGSESEMAVLHAQGASSIYSIRTLLQGGHTSIG
jgi:hypothetical protein